MPVAITPAGPMATTSRLAEAFGGEPGVTTGGVDEAPAKRDDRHLTAQRNIPREVANAMTDQPSLRAGIWLVRSLPKGTQAVRLMRYLEDKGWRRQAVGGRTILYHGRSFRMREEFRDPPWTLRGLYSLLTPRTAEDDDPRRIDRGLIRMWGVRSVDDVTGDYTLNTTPADSFIKFVSSKAEVERASNLADQLYQHTGIVLEPAAASLPAGVAVAQSFLPKSQLPPGVEPGDVVVVAEGGRFYAVLARDFGPGVVHDSRHVLDSGSVTATSRDPMVAVGVDPEGPGDRGSSVRADGGLTRIAKRAADLGRKHVFLVAAGRGKEGAHLQASPPHRMAYERGAYFGEDARVARNVRETGGLPLAPGRWPLPELRRYLRMFARDHGVDL